MSEQNPLIQATMQRTLFEITNALQYLITSLSGAHNTHWLAHTQAPALKQGLGLSA
jgi:hypothetical protein